VEECLEPVGLRERAEDRFKGYSLGMKQRLGIAAALLKKPRLGFAIANLRNTGAAATGSSCSTKVPSTAAAPSWTAVARWC